MSIHSAHQSLIHGHSKHSFPSCLEWLHREDRNSWISTMSSFYRCKFKRFWISLQKHVLLSIWISIIDFTIGGLFDLCLGEAQPLHFGAGWLPETRWTQNVISFLKQETVWASPCYLLMWLLKHGLLLKTGGMFVTLTAGHLFSSWIEGDVF